MFQISRYVTVTKEQRDCVSDAYTGVEHTIKCRGDLTYVLHPTGGSKSIAGIERISHIINSNVRDRCNQLRTEIKERQTELLVLSTDLHTINLFHEERTVTLYPKPDKDLHECLFQYSSAQIWAATIRGFPLMLTDCVNNYECVGDNIYRAYSTEPSESRWYYAGGQPIHQNAHPDVRAYVSNQTDEYAYYVQCKYVRKNGNIIRNFPKHPSVIEPLVDGTYKYLVSDSLDLLNLVSRPNALVMAQQKTLIYPHNNGTQKQCMFVYRNKILASTVKWPHLASFIEEFRQVQDNIYIGYSDVDPELLWYPAHTGKCWTCHVSDKHARLVKRPSRGRFYAACYYNNAGTEPIANFIMSPQVENLHDKTQSYEFLESDSRELLLELMYPGADIKYCNIANTTCVGMCDIEGSSEDDAPRSNNIERLGARRDIVPVGMEVAKYQR